MTAVLVLVLGSGVLVARLLRSITASMPLRYAIATVVGYGVFFVVLRLWARYLLGSLQAEAPAEVTPPMAAVVVSQIGEPDEAAAHKVQGGSWIGDVGSVDLSPGVPHGWSHHSSNATPNIDVGVSSSGGDSVSSGGSSSSFSFDGDGEGLVAIIVVALIALVAAVVLGAAVWCIWEAPIILSEVLFEVVLAGALARAARRAPDRGWSRTLLTHTWKPALAVFFVAVAVGAGVQAVCPTASTMREALNMCVFEHGAASRTEAR